MKPEWNYLVRKFNYYDDWKHTWFIQSVGNFEKIFELIKISTNIKNIIHFDIKLLTKNMGTSIVANIKLSLDSKTESRLKWTSKKGPKFHITDGTIANVSIVVKEEPPIVLALKFLRGIFNEG